MLSRVLEALEGHACGLVLDARHLESLLDHGPVPIERTREAALIQFEHRLLTVISCTQPEACFRGYVFLVKDVVAIIFFLKRALFYSIGLLILSDSPKTHLIFV